MHPPRSRPHLTEDCVAMLPPSPHLGFSVGGSVGRYTTKFSRGPLEASHFAMGVEAGPDQLEGLHLPQPNPYIPQKCHMKQEEDPPLVPQVCIPSAPHAPAPHDPPCLTETAPASHDTRSCFT